MKPETEFPYQAAGKIRHATKELIIEAEERFGVTSGALVRMALEDFLPRYLAGNGRPEKAEFLSELCAMLSANPEIQPQLEQWMRQKIRTAQRPARAA